MKGVATGYGCGYLTCGGGGGHDLVPGSSCHSQLDSLQP